MDGRAASSSVRAHDGRQSPRASRRRRDRHGQGGGIRGRHRAGGAAAQGDNVGRGRGGVEAGAGHQNLGGISPGGRRRGRDRWVGDDRGDLGLAARDAEGRDHGRQVSGAHRERGISEAQRGRRRRRDGGDGVPVEDDAVPRGRGIEAGPVNFERSRADGAARGACSDGRGRDDGGHCFSIEISLFATFS